MARDARVYLSDARDAADAIIAFTRGETFDGYVADPILHSAVERKFVIIGEALAQLARLDPALAARIPFPASSRFATSWCTATPSWTTIRYGARFKRACRCFAPI